MFILGFLLLGAWELAFAIEYLTVFRVVLGRDARSRMIATVSSSAGDHGLLCGTTENDAKYRQIFNQEDKSPGAKK